MSEITRETVVEVVDIITKRIPNAEEHRENNSYTKYIDRFGDHKVLSKGLYLYLFKSLVCDRLVDDSEAVDIIDELHFPSKNSYLQMELHIWDDIQDLNPVLLGNYITLLQGYFRTLGSVKYELNIEERDGNTLFLRITETTVGDDK